MASQPTHPDTLNSIGDTMTTIILPVEQLQDLTVLEAFLPLIAIGVAFLGGYCYLRYSAWKHGKK